MPPEVSITKANVNGNWIDIAFNSPDGSLIAYTAKEDVTCLVGHQSRCLRVETGQRSARNLGPLKPDGTAEAVPGDICDRSESEVRGVHVGGDERAGIRSERHS